MTDTTMTQNSLTPPLSVHSSTALTHYSVLRKNTAIGEQKALRCKEYPQQAEAKTLIRGNFMEGL